MTMKWILLNTSKIWRYPATLSIVLPCTSRNSLGVHGKGTLPVVAPSCGAAGSVSPARNASADCAASAATSAAFAAAGW
eukprot:scaffold504000_cov17-Prasinocladus_malaysianus.AAC.1